MAGPTVSLMDEKEWDRDAFPPGTVVVVVQPGPTELETALVEDRETRQRLYRLNRGKQYDLTSEPSERAALGKALRIGGAKIKKMIERWRKAWAE